MMKEGIPSTVFRRDNGTVSDWKEHEADSMDGMGEVWVGSISPPWGRERTEGVSLSLPLGEEKGFA